MCQFAHNRKTLFLLINGLVANSHTLEGLEAEVEGVKVCDRIYTSTWNVSQHLGQMVYLEVVVYP